MNNLTYNSTIKTMRDRKWLIFWSVVLCAFILFDISIFQTPEYKATSKILVIQKQMANQDVYAISKSAQYLTQVLKEGIYSDSFIEMIFESPYNISSVDFSSEIKQRRKEWESDVKVKVLRDLGAMEITVYYPDKSKVESISRAITAVLKDNNQFFHGAGNNVEIKVLDQPLVSPKPARPNIILNTGLGALLGLVIGFVLALRKVKNQEKIEREKFETPDTNELLKNLNIAENNKEDLKL